MNAIDLFRLVGLNLLRMKTRVGMTVTGVIIGTSAVILLFATGLGLQQNFLSGLGKMGDLTLLMVELPVDYNPEQVDPRRVGSSPALVLSLAVIDQFRQMPGVQAVSPLLRFPNAVTVALKFKHLESSPVIVGIDPSQLAGLGLELASGVNQIQAMQVVMGPQALNYFYDTRARQWVSERVHLQDQMVDLVISELVDDPSATPTSRRVRVKVVGILKDTGGSTDHWLIWSLEDVERWVTWKEGRQVDRARVGYSAGLVKVESVQAAISVEDQITQMGFRVISPRRMLEQMNQFFQFIQLALGGIGAIALLVSAFGVANTMTMAIYERTREIGLLKALGARNATIMLVFLTEAAAIGLLGGLAGAAASLGLGRLINSYGSQFLNPQTMLSAFGPPLPINTQAGGLVLIPSWLLWGAVLFAVGVGTLSGMYPAVRAASLDPLEAMRYE